MVLDHQGAVDLGPGLVQGLDDAAHHALLVDVPVVEPVERADVQQVRLVRGDTLEQPRDIFVAHEVQALGPVDEPHAAVRDAVTFRAR